MNLIAQRISHYYKVLKKEIDLILIRKKCLKLIRNSKDSYLSGSERGIFTSDIEVLNKARNNNIFEEYWSSQTDWTLQNQNNIRWQRQMSMIKEKFIPMLNKEDRVFDVASATGEWSFIIAPYVKQVDGFELAHGMVMNANKKAEDLGIKNTSFIEADLTQYSISKQYDKGMCLGLFTCLNDDFQMAKIIGRLYEIMSEGGVLLTKDTLNVDELHGDKDFYLYDFRNGYSAVFRTENNYYQFFRNAGFKVEYEVDLDNVDKKTGLKRVSRGIIWKK